MAFQIRQKVAGPAKRLLCGIESPATHIQRNHGCGPFGSPIDATTTTDPLCHLEKWLRRMRCTYTVWVWSAVDAKNGGTRNMKGDSRLNCGGASWRRQILEVAFFANRRCCASRPKSCSPTQMHSRQSTNGSGNAIGPRLKALSKKYIRCVPFVTFHYKAHRPSPSLQITVKNPQANGRHMSLVCSKVTCISSPSSAAAKGKSLKSE